MSAILAIDPGLSGGFAYKSEKGRLDVITLRGRSDGEIYEYLNHMVTPGTQVFMEKLGAMPSRFRGSITSWLLAEHVGKLKMALAIAGHSCTEVSPQTWQKVMGCNFTKPKKMKASAWYRTRKKKMLRKARLMYPLMQVNEDTADALLILSYASHLYK